MAKTILGLDIGSKYIKFAELVHLGHERFRLQSVGMAPAPLKGIASDAAIDLDALAVTIKKLLRDANVKAKDVNIALPEANVFTRIITVPPLSERELASSIKWEAEQYIPLPLEEANIDFSIVGETKDSEGNKKLDVLLVAAPMTLVNRYSKVLEKCDLEANAMETEIISASRALLPPSPDKPLTVIVVNIGAKTTDLSILRKGVISFTRSVPVGGETLTKTLAQDFGFPLTQAEEYKKTYGLEKDKLEGKVQRSLKQIFIVISDEIKRAITYFQNKFPDEQVTSIILSGGTAKLPGLVEAMVEEVGIETQVGDPWLRIERDKERFAKLNDEGPMFVVAIGLAMRSE